MVADLTRLSACTVDPDAPDRPVPEAKVEGEAPIRVDKPDNFSEEPVRLFVWASA